MSAVDQTYQTLVDQVKQMQKDSPEFKQAWWAYCAAYGNNTRDPSSHPMEFLVGFLEQHAADPTALASLAPNGGVPETQEHSKLVQQVKEVQKASHEGKVAWTSWCCQRPGGSRDPIVHDKESLQGFLAFMRAQPRSAWSPPGAAGPTGFHAELVALVKAVQRMPAGKADWGAWCGQYGGGSRDPSIHDEMFLASFLQSQGISIPMIPHMGMAMMQPMVPIMRPPMMMAPGRGPRPTAGGLPGPAVAGGAAQLKQQLADAIKLYQRTSEEFRVAWAEYCAMYAGNSRDPKLHDLPSLQGFASLFPDCFTVAALRSIGLASASASPSPVYPPAKRPRLAAGGGLQVNTHSAAMSQQAAGGNMHDLTHAELVTLVKSGQVASLAWKEAWATFCDANACGTRDPSLHHTETLKAFVDQYASLLPTLVQGPQTA